MCAQEMATARMRGANGISLVVDTGMSGTLRMHQAVHSPDRKMATDLFNPDFGACAATFGITGKRVAATAAVAPGPRGTDGLSD